VRAGEKVAIRGEDGEALLSYRSFASVVGIVAIVVSVLVLVTGAAAVVFLMVGQRPLPAAFALVLSAGFAVLIAMLVPPVNVTLNQDVVPVLLITQESNVSFPSVTFVVSTPERKVLARLRKRVWSRLGQNRWDILNATDDRPMGYAEEESLSRAFVRKVGGKFNARYQADVRIDYLDKNVGWIMRRANGAPPDTLAINGAIDHRVAVALATLILGSEP
jgi:hypothetical protein